MCVFGYANKRINNAMYANDTSVGLFIGALFLAFKAYDFKKSVDKIADALLGKVIASEAQKNAFLNLVKTPNYFSNIKKANLNELNEAKKVLLTIDNPKLRKNLIDLDFDLAKENPRRIVHSQFEAQYNLQQLKLKAIDQWLSLSKSEVKQAINKTIETNSINYLNKYSVEHGDPYASGLMSDEQILKDAQILKAKSKHFSKWSLSIVITSLVLIAVTLIYSNMDDAIKKTVEEYASWDLADVRNHFSKPENQDEMENLAAQAKDCGCY